MIFIGEKVDVDMFVELLVGYFFVECVDLVDDFMFWYVWWCVVRCFVFYGCVVGMVYVVGFDVNVYLFLCWCGNWLFD